MTNPFVRANTHLAYIKPELKMFIEVIGLEARDMLNIININDPAILEELDLNGIVECLSDQLQYIWRIGNPRLLICHMTDNEIEARVNNKVTKTFIFIGKVEAILLQENDPQTRVFHRKESDTTEDDAIILHESGGEEIEVPIQYQVLVPRAPQAVPPSIHIINRANTQVPIARNIQYVIDRSSGDNAIHTKHTYSSILANGILTIGMNTGSPEAHHFLIIHGRPTKIITSDTKSDDDNQKRLGTLTVILPDMAQYEVKDIIDDRFIFGADSTEISLTSARQYILGRSITEQLFPNSNMQTWAGIDSYVDVMYRKRRDPKALKLLIMRMEMLPKGTNVEGQKRTGGILNVISQRIQFESSLDTQTRSILLGRHKELKGSKNPAKLPYQLETVRVGANEVLEDMIRRNHLKDETFPPARHFFIPGDDQVYEVKGEYFAIIKGAENAKLHIQDCGLVIIDCEGEDMDVKVCGKVHTIISGENVSILFDTISEEKVEEDTYLFVESSNVYDSVGKWKDMPHEDLMTIKEDNQFDQKRQITPPIANNTHRCHQAIVRLLIYNKLPDNLYTSRIQTYYKN